MTTLYVICGLPGSGKSTLCEYLSKSEGLVVCSYDKIARTSQLTSNEVYTKWVTDIKLELLNGKDVIADSTNLTVKSRKELLQYLGNIDCRKVLIALNTPLSECIKRNESRQFSLPYIVIADAAKIYEFPREDELGWDDILVCCEKE